ncbi:MAG: S8/S53 family peptidase [Myxococcota bacterium]
MKLSRPAPLVALSALSVLAPGCVDVTDIEPEFIDEPAHERDTQTVTEADYAGACPDTRFIARSISPSHCPEIDGWIARSLFEEGSPWLMAAPSAAVSDSDGHLCRYSWDEVVELGEAHDNLELAATGLAATVDDPEPPVPPVLHDYSSDCEVVRGQRGSAISDVVGPGVRQVFRDQIGWVPGVALPPGSSPVAVAVVDTMPTSEPDDPRSEHGELMARIIEDVACSGGFPCDVSVSRILGLPRYIAGEDRDRGGYVGSHGDLAVGIVESVERWRLGHPIPALRPPLIINLSVGWEATLFGSGETVSTEAVEIAMEYASCHGALLVASAGNSNSACQAGAMAPAMWENRAAPDSARCQELGFPPNSWNSGYRPLVHAVGGLTFQGEDMPGTRPESMPRMAAHSTHAYAGSAVLSSSLTGTSVGAAAVTGAAALVWSYDPSLQAHEVMELVYAGSADLGRNADLHIAGNGADTVHRLDVCEVLQNQCSQDALCSAAGVNLGCTPPAHHDMDAVADAVANIPVADSYAPAFGAALACAPICGVPSEAYSETSTVCNEIEPDPVVLFVNPQPNLPTCSNCTLTDDDADDDAEAWQVHASLDSFYDGAPIERVVVTVTSDIMERFDFGAVPLSSDRVTVLELGSWVAPPHIRAAEIDMYFTGKDAPVTNDIIVKQ